MKKKLVQRTGNTGDRKGTETVQLYMQDVTASLVRPVKELKGFQRVELEAGEKCKVHLELKKRDMGFYDNKGKYLWKTGCFGSMWAEIQGTACLKKYGWNFKI